MSEMRKVPRNEKCEEALMTGTIRMRIDGLAENGMDGRLQDWEIITKNGVTFRIYKVFPIEDKEGASILYAVKKQDGEWVSISRNEAINFQKMHNDENYRDSIMAEISLKVSALEQGKDGQEIVPED